MQVIRRGDLDLPFWSTQCASKRARCSGVILSSLMYALLYAARLLKFSDGAHEARRLQPKRDAAARFTLIVGGLINVPIAFWAESLSTDL